MDDQRAHLPDLPGLMSEARAKIEQSSSNRDRPGTSAARPTTKAASAVDEEFFDALLRTQQATRIDSQRTALQPANGCEL